jgi:3-methyladenine DNA glycosylase AlkD
MCGLWHRRPMDAGAALAALEQAGTEQNRKVYRRHGYPEPMFGVSFATLRGMAKQIGVDQALAEELWASGNTDARLLAANVADAEALTREVADRWIAEARCPTLVDEVAKVVARSPLALPCMAEWVGADDEWIGRAGWSVMAVLANEHPEVPDASFTPYLAVIERKIEAAHNRTREAMNTALIAIGGRSDALASPATAAAKRIGAVDVDHGETSCETPDAISYIAKVRARANGARPAGRAKTAPPATTSTKKAAPAKAKMKTKAKKPAAAAKKATAAKPAKKKSPAPAKAAKKKPRKR